jgi:hypothetical protein
MGRSNGMNFLQAPQQISCPGWISMVVGLVGPEREGACFWFIIAPYLWGKSVGVMIGPSSKVVLAPNGNELA